MRDIRSKTVSLDRKGLDDGDYTIKVHPDRFAGSEKEQPLGKRSERKYNIRVRQEDIFLLDALAKANGVTRSTLINQLIHDILLDDLMQMQELDARTLLATAADRRAHYDELESRWVLDAAYREIDDVIDNILTDNATYKRPPDRHTPRGSYLSDAYSVLRKKLEEMPK